mmetsp:Transcript_31223/g.87962  ORF Transcript_31223/g.87962 Transcript_31223/m.87962 type:complete len:254 (-) Transcript_31223:265-1026(-)
MAQLVEDTVEHVALEVALAHPTVGALPRNCPKREGLVLALVRHSVELHHRGGGTPFTPFRRSSPGWGLPAGGGSGVVIWEGGGGRGRGGVDHVEYAEEVPLRQLGGVVRELEVLASPTGRVRVKPVGVDSRGPPVVDEDIAGDASLLVSEADRGEPLPLVDEEGGGLPPVELNDVLVGGVALRGPRRHGDTPPDQPGPRERVGRRAGRRRLPAGALRGQALLEPFGLDHRAGEEPADALLAQHHVALDQRDGR